jgi:hypothetical protein
LDFRIDALKDLDYRPILGSTSDVGSTSRQALVVQRGGEVTPEQTNAALAILTFLLAAATVWLAIAIWRMASVSKVSFDLESRSYFAFKDFLFKFFLEKPANDTQPPTKGSVRIGLKFKKPWSRSNSLSSQNNTNNVFWGNNRQSKV